MAGDPAPLLDPAWSALAEPGQAEWFTGAGGARLRAALFRAPNPIGAVVLSGGRAEFIEKYLEVIADLVGRGFTVLTHDWRGQGLSHRLAADRLKGCADGFDDFLIDFQALLAAFEDRLPQPWIALGHSMGGCLTLMALTQDEARGEARFSGAILSAPMLGLQAGPPTLARLLSRTLRRAGLGRRYLELRPPGPLAGSFESNQLTHDRERFERSRDLIRACPDLALGAVTWGWVDSAFTAVDRLAHGPELPRLTLPVVMVAAEDEALVDNAATAAVARRIPKGRYVMIPGARHELLMETDPIRAAFFREFDALAATVIGAD